MDVGRRVLKYYEDDDIIAVIDKHYPLYPYGNYFSYSYEVDKRGKRLILYHAHDEWNGTGSETIINVPLTDEEFELMAGLLKRVSRFRHVDVLDQIYRIFNRCKVDDDCEEKMDRIRQLAEEVK